MDTPSFSEVVEKSPEFKPAFDAWNLNWEIHTSKNSLNEKDEEAFRGVQDFHGKNFGAILGNMHLLFEGLRKVNATNAQMQAMYDDTFASLERQRDKPIPPIGDSLIAITIMPLQFFVSTSIDLIKAWEDKPLFDRSALCRSLFITYKKLSEKTLLMTAEALLKGR